MESSRDREGFPYGHTFGNSLCKRCGQLHFVEAPQPVPEAVYQRRQKSKWAMKRAKIAEVRRLRDIPLCKGCNFYCSACGRNKKCCLERAKKEYKPSVVVEEERKPFPEELGYAIGPGSQGGPEDQYE